MKLTVLIPAYNTHPSHLMEAVHCILSQDHKEAHPIMIIDDGSTDKATLAILELLSKGGYQARINILTKTNGGISSALNAAHKLVNTEYVALMGSDDVCHSSRLRLQCEYLQRHPQTDILGTNLFSFYNDDITRKPPFTSRHKEIPLGSVGDKRWLVNHGTVVYRNKAVLDTGGYNLGYRRAQDVELWGRMAEKGYIFRNITQVLYGWRRFR